MSILNAPTPANEIATPVTTAEDEIHRTCLNVKTYLLLWDNVLSLVKTKYPTSADCDEMQQRISEIVELADSMGMKRSLKMHTCMVHLVLDRIVVTRKHSTSHKPHNANEEGTSMVIG